MKRENKIFENILLKEPAAFVIDEEKFADNINSLLKSFQKYYSKTKIGYSYKTNYIPHLCRIAHDLGCYAEVVSEMEVDMGLHNLTEKSNIIYNGPIKTDKSLQDVLYHGGIVNIDNFSDVEKIDRILVDTDLKAKVAIRLSVDYESNSSRFGMDLQDTLKLKDALLSKENYDLIGFHLHLPFRSYDSFKFRVAYFIKVLGMMDDVNIRYVNFGGGYFGKISESLAESLGIADPPGYDDYGKLIGQAMADLFNDKTEKPVLFLEPGSAVVADACKAISRIHSTKSIEDRNYLITFLGRHLVSPTNKNSMLPVFYRKFEGKSDVSDVELERYIVSAYTCIESDLLGEVEVPGIAEDGYVVVENVGSYSVVMGSDFILPQPAIYSIRDGEARLVRRARSSQDVIDEFLV